MPFAIFSILFLIAIDAAIYFAARRAAKSKRAQSVQGFPALWAAGICAVAAAAHTTAGMWVAAYVGSRAAALVVSTLTGIAPAIALSVLVLGSFSRGAVKMVFGRDEEAVELPNMRAAAACLKLGDVEGALDAYRELHRDFPEFPDPLFAMQTLLAQQYRFEEAAEMCRELIRRFQNDDVIWTRSCGLLAELLREQLDDEAGAAAIEEAVLERNPATRHGYLQGEARAIAATERRPKSKAHSFHDMEQARRLVKRGEVDAAVDLYRRCQRDRPADPKPSMEAATALEVDGQYQRALDELQRAAHVFSDESKVWCELALRMAGVYSNHLDRPGAARDVLAEVKNRAPSFELRQLAVNRITALDSKRG